MGLGFGVKFFLSNFIEIITLQDMEIKVRYA